MSQAPGAPIGFETGRAHTPPLCTQFSVFLDNRIGKLYELLEVFDDTPIRIVALSVIDSSDHAVVRLVTTRSDRARELLNDHEMPFSEAEILVVELGPDQRLTKLCLSLLAAEINIDYAYPLMARPHGSPTMAVRADDPILAGQILTRKGFGLISEEQLRESIGGDYEVA
jgi:hypothetical protein